MDAFALNSAKSYVGKHVNLHLKDGTVLVNVLLVAIEDKRVVRYRGGACFGAVLVREVSYAQNVPTQLLESS